MAITVTLILGLIIMNIKIYRDIKQWKKKYKYQQRTCNYPMKYIIETIKILFQLSRSILKQRS